MKRITLTILLLALCGGCLLPAGCVSSNTNQGELYLRFGTTITLGSEAKEAAVPMKSELRIDLLPWVQEEIKKGEADDEGDDGE